MSKKVLSCKDRVKYEHSLSGVLWILAGILWIPNNTVCKIISAILLISAGVIQVRTLLGKHEEEDEMAEAHMNEAMSVSFWCGELMLITLSLLSGEIFRSLLNKSVDLSNHISSIVYIIIGIQNIIVGVHFKKLEDE